MFRFTWRFFTGAHMDGKQRTNATWRTRGTLPKHRLTWWASMPRLHRMAWRNAIFFTLTLIGLGTYFAPGATWWLVSACIPFALSRLWRVARRRITHRIHVRPKLSSSEFLEIDIPELDNDDLAEQETVIGEIAAELPVNVEEIPIRKPRRQAK